jgi:hypothetical protein
MVSAVVLVGGNMTPCSCVRLGKVTVLHLVKTFPAFYWTRTFIAVFTADCHVSLSWARLIHSTPLPSHFFKIKIFQVVSWLQVSPPEPCKHFSSPHVHHAPLNTWIIFADKCKSWNNTTFLFLQDVWSFHSSEGF